MTDDTPQHQPHHRVGGWLAANHVSTWLLIGVLIATALIVRPQLLNFIAFAVIAAMLFIIRDLARVEGRSGVPVFGRSTWIAILVIVLVIAVMAYGVRYVAI